ncbi:MAG: CPA2 family monovalent cation:H+ antiporter-2 [Chlamydiales bacterium]
MNLWQILLDVVILLGVGALLGGLLERVRQSAIIGYLLAGVLLGPNVLHVIQSTDEVIAISELGVALLLFAIGLEFSWTRLRGMGKVALGSGAVQVATTAVIVAGVATLAGLGPKASIAIGAICALSSTACVLRVLTARGEVESVHGERVLGILLLQDMAVVPLVLIVSVLAESGTGQEVFWEFLRTTSIGLVLVGALYVIFNYLVPRLLETTPMRSNRELSLLIAVVSGLGSAVAAHAAGVSPALGAFLAGLLLAESPFAVQVRADVSSLKTLLLTLFFTSMGMLSDPGWIASNALLVGAAVAVVVLGKSAIVWGSLRLFGASGRNAIAAGLCLGQIGEFSFVLAEIARGSLLDEQMFMLIVSTTVITMTLTPYLVGNAPVLASRLARRPLPTGRDTDKSGVANIAVVIGFGPAGRAASERIAEAGCHVVVVDENPTAAREAQALGYGSVTGDARYSDVLAHAGIQNAAVVIVTLPGAETAIEVVRDIRLHNPAAFVFVRARFHRSLTALKAAGAHVVIDEEHEVGRLIAEAYETITSQAAVGRNVTPE